MQKKIPMRQCLGCRAMKPKKELIRAVRAPDGSVSLDVRGKNPGRGAYVCQNADCLKKALKTKALERALETAFPEDFYEALKVQLEEADGQ
ncbi:YlxR family protein [Oscillospiraceae bacterium CM]|nr:YlxR family protein [Oscillospiraceae bacterium CM]